MCPAWATPLEDNSVASLRARHFLEHLTFEQACKTMIEWRRIVMPDGELNVTVPNILFHARQLTMGGTSPFVPTSNFNHAIAGFYGWQVKGETMGHRWGYTPKTLLHLFQSNRFDAVIMPSRECDIVVHARKGSLE